MGIAIYTHMSLHKQHTGVHAAVHTGKLVEALLTLHCTTSPEYITYMNAGSQIKQR